jgi:transposase-like protein
MNKISYSGDRFPSEIIQHTIWLYIRFSLSFRDVEGLLADLGITVSYETIRQMCESRGFCEVRGRVSPRARMRTSLKPD